MAIHLTVCRVSRAISNRFGMSNQAFLARQRRIAEEAPEAQFLESFTVARQRRIAEEVPEAQFLESFTTKKPPLPTNVSSVGEMLHQARDRLTALFDIWDEDKDRKISRAEFRKAMKTTGFKFSDADIEGFFDLADVSRTHSLTLEQLLEATKTPRRPKEQEQEPRTAMRRFVIEPLQALNMMLNSKTVQTLLYAAFVVTTQLLIHTLRVQEEYYLDKFYTDTFM